MSAHGAIAQPSSDRACVLSLPTFWAVDTTIEEYDDTIQQFIHDATAASKSKIVIDLQQNGGGDHSSESTRMRV